MRLQAIIFASALLFATPILSAEVMPDTVVFGEDGDVALSLTGVAGDPVAGKKVFINRKLGNCLACHVNTDASDQSFHGEVGPALDGAADRWDTAQLRGIVVNSKKTFEDSIMPSFYRKVNGVRTMEKFEGKTILSAQQVEDVLAYLQTLKE
ncbi:MAG: sulfur oxidation c-type cytochrome SoxX [Rhodobacteraceae bacterium]|nr:MAG: sulfur oxidation c-type cytochrome SoxX [Paracoccaceae bacterium]